MLRRFRSGRENARSRRARHSQADDDPRCRVDRSTKQLIGRLLPGEVAVISHSDVDRVAADGLIAAGVTAVINAATTATGEYPALGGMLLAQAGITIVDEVGDELFRRISEGEHLRIEGDTIWRGDDALGVGIVRDEAHFETVLEAARANFDDRLGAFARNTLHYLEDEPELITEELQLPALRVSLRRRHVLVVVRGIDYREDLAALRRSGYLTDLRPVLIGVDGGADALLDVGLTPDIIVGDFDSVSAGALNCGAQLLVHAYRGGDAPGAKRLDEAGVSYDIVEAPGTSEDLALRIAFEQRCEQLVEVGSHTSLADFFDKGRQGMASTFLTRMRVASVLVDAKGVSRLYRTSVRTLDLLAMVAAAAVTLTIIAVVTEPTRLLLRTLWLQLGL